MHCEDLRTYVLYRWLHDSAAKSFGRRAAPDFLHCILRLVWPSMWFWVRNCPPPFSLPKARTAASETDARCGETSSVCYFCEGSRHVRLCTKIFASYVDPVVSLTRRIDTRFLRTTETSQPTLSCQVLHAQIWRLPELRQETISHHPDG